MAKSVESVITALKASIERELSKGDTHPTTWRKLSTLVSACGWTNRTSTRMHTLAAAIAAARLYASHDLTDLDLGLDTSIRFSKAPWTDLTKIFKDESELGYHLSKYPSALENAIPHLGKLSHLHGGRKKEREYFYEDTSVFPDLVFRSAQGGIVVVELERGDPKDESVNQLERYLDAAAKRHGMPVSGVLITGSPRRAAQRRQFNDHLTLLRKRHPDITWLSYDVKVSLSQER